MMTKPKPKKIVLDTATSNPQEKGYRNLKEALIKGELVVITGTGVSLAMTNGQVQSLSWRGLIEDGLAEAVLKGQISSDNQSRWGSHLDSSDIDEWLGVAEYVSRKLGAPSGNLYINWMNSVFADVEPINNEIANAFKCLSGAGVPLATLNYDSLLEQATGFSSVTVKETSSINGWMRQESNQILHLHGVWTQPATCILGIRDYATTVGNEVRDLIQRSLGAFKHLLFIGCGDTFSDPNFSSLINWMRSNFTGATPTHYALVTDDELGKRFADSTWHGFVEPLSYGPEKINLAAFIKGLVDEVNLIKNQPTVLSNLGVVLNDEIIRGYRSFLVRDCGQMTIEGLRADMDTAQRKFDLERLFVPLKVTPVPPEIPENDPLKEKKLASWAKKNGMPTEFGEAFSRVKRIALLALPGGGKTLLLKRLAVAYADATRRGLANDALPALDVIPVLIRCREWREDIRRPILTLLNKMAEVTGQPSLEGLGDALVPLLMKGKILLMVDGLDEIHDDGDRTTFVDNLEAFLEQYTETRLVVTSREAGFDLVAPSLSRFCIRYKVAALDEFAIRTLCDHWQKLMVGDSVESLEDAKSLVAHLLRNTAIRRLAENPLLLTMLLVVKHGAGRLPPDRVSLYARAVEVLLDTWNIKGHEPLNLKEAVPQLACVAFELLKQGKQTATKRELLELLENAREMIPQIGRYSRDRPDEFLRRVELRSSVLVEAGRQIDGALIVPFYQFRHLTFQEYLAAYAVAEGYYLHYKKGDDILVPLANSLTSSEWKEVVPMAAVLARKQADPLIARLVAEGNKIRKAFENNRRHHELDDWKIHGQLPPTISRLTQCLIEEAQVPADQIGAALDLVAIFAHGCKSEENWDLLGEGPYGQELYRRAWDLYASGNCPENSWIRNTAASLVARQRSLLYWSSSEGSAEVSVLLSSEDEAEKSKGALICCGLIWNDLRGIKDNVFVFDREQIEPLVFNETFWVWEPAAWAWGLNNRGFFARNPASDFPRLPSIEFLDRLRKILLLEVGDKNPLGHQTAGFALSTIIGMPRSYWCPDLSQEEVKALEEILKEASENHARAEEYIAALIICYHARAVISDRKLLEALRGKMQSRSDVGAGFERVIAELSSSLSASRRRKKIAKDD